MLTDTADSQRVFGEQLRVMVMVANRCVTYFAVVGWARCLVVVLCLTRKLRTGGFQRLSYQVFLEMSVL